MGFEIILSAMGFSNLLPFVLLSLSWGRSHTLGNSTTTNIFIAYSNINVHGHGSHRQTWDFQPRGQWPSGSSCCMYTAFTDLF